MNSRLKNLIPTRVLARLRDAQSVLRLRREFDADRRRYARYAAPSDQFATTKLTDRNLEAQVTKDYHRVEKGLALSAPRQPFGAEVAARLDLLIPHARSTNPGAPYIAHAVTARAALAEWNSRGALDADVSPSRVPRDRGISDPEAFFGSRHSVRDFSDRQIPDDVLKRAVALALNTPSVCNRQSWRVRFYRDLEARRVLTHQNGNAGFGDSVPVVALVSVDIRLFAAEGERNQAWIEGGLFSMSLALGLHGLGLDTCMLNMSQPNGAIDALRAEVGVPDHELVVMMLAIGYGRKGHRRARSPRRKLDEVLE